MAETGEASFARSHEAAYSSSSLAQRRQRALRAVPEAAECELSVVFPCRNEAGAVSHCVREALAELRRAGTDGEVIVCDNASDDDSAARAELAGARVVEESRPGYGRALNTGIQAARGKYIIMADADGTYDLGAITPILASLEAGADMVIGHRFKGTIAPGAMPWMHRYIGSPLTSALLNLFFGTSVGDVHSGMRGFTREAYYRMALQTSGMEFASEMIARAARIGLKIAQVPIDYHPRSGESKLRTYRDGWRHLRFLLMYSPTWLYVVPSAILVLLGLSLLLTLSISPIVVLGRQWDMHLSAIASLLTVLGTQLAWIGISARTLAVIHGFDPEDPFIARFYRWFTLERGLLVAAFVTLGGLAYGAFLAFRWVAAGLPAIDQIRPLLLVITLVMIGVQSVFNAFFLSLLSIETRAVEPR